MVTKARVCICGHISSDHIRGRYFCQSQDIYDPEWKCNCDWYESEPDTTSENCDDCLGVSDNGISGLAELYDALASMGDIMEDHLCSRMIEPSIRCDCKGHV